jgi:hypothetical protein
LVRSAVSGPPPVVLDAPRMLAALAAVVEAPSQLAKTPVVAETPKELGIDIAQTPRCFPGWDGPVINYRLGSTIPEPMGRMPQGKCVCTMN